MPHQSRPSWPQGKGLQTVHECRYGVIGSAFKSVQQGLGMMTGMNRWDQVSGQPPIGNALEKKFSKILFPTIDGGTPWTQKALELLQGMVRISSLAKGGGDKKHRRPVYPALPKTNRWRKNTAPATFTAATQAITNRICLIQIRRAAPRLSQIVGIMQRPPAIGQCRTLACSASSRSIL